MRRSLRGTKGKSAWRDRAERDLPGPSSRAVNDIRSAEDVLGRGSPGGASVRDCDGSDFVARGEIHSAIFRSLEGRRRERPWIDAALFKKERRPTRRGEPGLKFACAGGDGGRSAPPGSPRSTINTVAPCLRSAIDSDSPMIPPPMMTTSQLFTRAL